MERTGKYEKFPVLQPGDVVVCGGHTAYIVTGKGGYMFRSPAGECPDAVLCGYVEDFEDLLDDSCSGEYQEYIPEAVFRRSGGHTIPAGFILKMIADWRSVGATTIETFSRVWSIDDDNAKELTVDEVSKLLGYKVKIVGAYRRLKGGKTNE
jgi:hypothetical protein